MDFALRKAFFDRLCEDVLRTPPEGDSEGGIGTLGEKRMHALIKRFLCPNTDFHEVPLAGTRYVSDLRIGDEITEVQTGSFYPMQKKLIYYMSHTDCNVTVVHPLPARKWVSWIQPETLEISKPSRSPRAATVIDLFPALYALLPVLGNERITYRVLLLEVQEFRWQNGYGKNRKRGSERYERLPVSLLEDISLRTAADFRAVLPSTLHGTQFTVKEFSSATRLRGRDAYSAVHALEAMGVLQRREPIGRAMSFFCPM